MHDSTFKDYFKFLAVHEAGKIQVGVLIVRNIANDVAQPYRSLVCLDILRFRDIISVPILVVGIPFKSRANQGRG